MDKPANHPAEDDEPECEEDDSDRDEDTQNTQSETDSDGDNEDEDENNNGSDNDDEENETSDAESDENSSKETSIAKVNKKYSGTDLKVAGAGTSREINRVGIIVLGAGFDTVSELGKQLSEFGEIENVQLEKDVAEFRLTSAKASVIELKGQEIKISGKTLKVKSVLAIDVDGDQKESASTLESPISTRVGEVESKKSAAVNGKDDPDLNANVKKHKNRKSTDYLKTQKAKKIADATLENFEKNSHEKDSNSSDEIPASDTCAQGITNDKVSRKKQRINAEKESPNEQQSFARSFKDKQKFDAKNTKNQKPQRAGVTREQETCYKREASRLNSSNGSFSRMQSGAEMQFDDQEDTDFSSKESARGAKKKNDRNAVPTTQREYADGPKVKPKPVPKPRSTGKLPSSGFASQSSDVNNSNSDSDSSGRDQEVILVQDLPDNVNCDNLEMILENKKYTGITRPIEVQEVIPVNKLKSNSAVVFVKSRDEAEALLRCKKITYNENTFRTGKVPEEILQIIFHSVVVMDVPDNMSEETLELVFGNDKRGGDIVSCKLDKNKSKAIITFVEEKVARSLIEKGSVEFKTNVLKIKKFCFDEDLIDTEDHEHLCSILVNGIPSDYDDFTLSLILEKFCYFKELRRKGSSALVIYNKPQDAKMVLVKEQIVYGGRVLLLEQPNEETYRNFTAEEEANESSNTVKVINVPDNVDSATLRAYFSNERRSAGGEIENLTFSKETRKALIVFRASKVAERVCAAEHTLSSQRLTVLRVESNPNVMSLAVKVTGFSDIPTETEVRRYFENGRESGGGPVENVFIDHQKRSAVITFREESAIIGVLKQKQHRLSGRELKVEQLAAQPPPLLHHSVDETKLLVKNIDSSVPNVEIALSVFLTKDEYAEVRSIDRCLKESQLLIDLQNPPDYKSLRLLVCKKPFKGSMISVHRVAKPHQLIVTGSSLSPTRDVEFLKKYFGHNSSLIVKEVVIRNKNCAIITFEQPIENSCSLIRKHNVDGKELMAEPYYPFRDYQVIRSAESEACNAVHEVTVDPEIWDVVQNSPELRKAVEDKMDSDGYNLSWGIGGTNLVQLRLNVPSNASGWFDMAGTALKNLLSKVDIDVQTDNYWDRIETDALKLKLKYPAIGLKIDSQNKHILAVGFERDVCEFKDEVQEVEKSLANECKESEQLLTCKLGVLVTVAKYDLLESSEFFDQMKAKSTDLMVNFDPSTNDLEITAKKSEMDMIKEQILKKCCSMHCEKRRFDGDKLKCLEMPEIKKIITKAVHDKLLTKNVSFTVVGENCELCGYEQDVINTAAGLILELLVSWKSSPSQSNLSQEYEKFIKELQKEFSANLLIEVESNNAVKIVGLQEQVNSASDKIERYREENDLIVKKLEMIPAYCNIIRNHLQPELSKVTRSLDEFIPPDDGRWMFEFRGKRQSVESAYSEVQNLAGRIFPADHQVRNGQYFLTQAGRDRLNGIGKRHKVEIEVNLEENEIKGADGGRDTARQMVIGKHGQQVILFEGDIANYKGDCIVVWEHAKAHCGVTKAIIKKAGDDIETDLKNCKVNLYHLSPGETIELKPGNLACKRIIVGFAPIYKNGLHNEFQNLYLAVMKCLQLASQKKCFNIVMAYIEKDFFKFPKDVACQVYVQAIQDFIIQNETSSLREFILVDTSRDILSEFEEILSSMETEESREETQEDIRIRRNVKYDAAFFRKVGSDAVETANGLTVTLSFGSLLNEKVDALVNTCNISLDLTRGAVSSALLTAAGKEIEDECKKKKPPNFANGDVIKTAGYKLQCKSVYHGSILAWDNGAGKCEQTMRKLLGNVLKDAEISGISSLAIPAIGTGNLNVPHEFAAKLMFSEVEKFSRAMPKSNLKDIRFVVYQQDQTGVAAFKKTMSVVVAGDGNASGGNGARIIDTRQRTEAGSGITLSYDPPSKRATIGSLKLHVKNGDVTKEVTDAIVNSTNRELDLRKGLVSKAIAKAGGDALIRECREGKLNDKGIFVSRGGNLPARHVIHVLAPNSDGGWIERIQNCLIEADTKGCNDITFPLLGTGNMSGTSAQMANNMTEAVIKFLNNRRPTNLRKIVVCVFELDKVQQFTSALEARCKKQENRSAAAAPRSDGNRMRSQEVELQIYGFTEASILAAIREIDQLVAEDMCLHTFETEHDKEIIQKLTNAQVNAILDIKTENGLEVEISVIKEQKVNQIKVKGRKDDVTTAVNIIARTLEQANNDLEQRARDEKLKDAVQWQYKDVGKWESYPEKLNALIEKASLSKAKFYEWDENGRIYRICFHKMCEENVATGSSTAVRRSFAHDFPAFWDKMTDDEIVKVVSLDPASAEYKKVEQNARMTSGTCLNQVVKIERIQNKKLHKQYATIMECMETETRKNRIERMLWHGTKQGSIVNINNDGFDRGYNGANATLFGQGSYFAVNFWYSGQTLYSPPDPTTGLKHVYQCKVLCGDFVQGNQTMKHLPPPPSSAPNGYDSAVDNPATPGMFVIFKDAQAYPEYLIYFN